MKPGREKPPKKLREVVKHAISKIFCSVGVFACFVLSSSKRYENRGSMRFSTRKGHFEKQWRTLIGSKCSVCRGRSYFLVGAWGLGNTTKIGVFQSFADSWPGKKGVKKKGQGSRINLCAFFPKILTENSGVFFQERLKLVRGCFLASSGYDWVMRPKTTLKIGISGALKGCIKRARYKGREEVNLGDRATLAQWTAFLQEKKGPKRGRLLTFGVSPFRRLLLWQFGKIHSKRGGEMGSLEKCQFRDAQTRPTS